MTCLHFLLVEWYESVVRISVQVWALAMFLRIVCSSVVLHGAEVAICAENDWNDAAESLLVLYAC